MRTDRPRCRSVLVRDRLEERCRLTENHLPDHAWWGGAARVEWTDRGVVVASNSAVWREGATYEVRIDLREPSR